MPSRRKAIKSLVSVPFIGALLSPEKLTASSSVVNNLTTNFSRDYFKELGVRTFINAAGTYTSMTGSLMPKEVIEAINYGALQYVNLDELQDKVGERIADLLDCEYATVSSGCFGAMSIAMAGVMCGKDQQKVKQLPNTKGMKNEVILQESHTIGLSLIHI